MKLINATYALKIANIAIEVYGNLNLSMADAIDNVLEGL